MEENKCPYNDPAGVDGPYKVESSMIDQNIDGLFPILIECENMLKEMRSSLIKMDLLTRYIRSSRMCKPTCSRTFLSKLASKMLLKQVEKRRTGFNRVYNQYLTLLASILVHLTKQSRICSTISEQSSTEKE